MAAIGQQTVEQAAPDAPHRMDPEEGDLVGPISMTDLTNKDPGKHYVFVARNRQSMQEYKRMGYKPEVGREGGVHVAGEDPEIGREVECMDHVLMSVSQERHASITKRGAFGEGGQDRVDSIEARIIDKRNVADHFRGASPSARKGHIRIYNQTTDLEEET